MQLRVKTAVRLFGAVVAAGLLAAVAISLLAVNQIRVGGPVYGQIVQGKDLVADILPPPAYLIEAYLEATLAFNRAKPIPASRARLKTLHTQYDERRAFWLTSELQNAIKTKLTGDSHKHVLQIWQAVDEKLLPALERGDQTAATQAYGKVSQAYDAHRAVIDEIVAAAETMNNAIEGESAAQGRNALTLVLGVVGVVLAIVLIGVFLLSRGVVSPLVQLTNAMGKLASGDFKVVLPGLGRKDEIGEIATAVEEFKVKAEEKARREAEETAQRQRADSETQAKAAEEQARAAAEQAEVVKHIATGLTKLSQGDLTSRIEAAFPPAYQQLKNDFNAAMKQLQETVLTIVRAAHEIHSGTTEFSQATDDLSKRTEAQAASLEQTAAAVDEITATVRKSADGANHAKDIVTKAREDAQQSSEIVRRAVEAMTAIEGSAKQISQIIGVIDEIAFQTNLLALNAGVEAARAGDAGRGFAVVASEVRSLAQRSAEAAKEIKSLISASTTQVDGGVKLVHQTGTALDAIAKQVTEINDVVGEIAASAHEQATGLAEVNTAVNQMDQVTQQNAAMVEESTAASHALAGEARKLAELVSGFNVGHVADAARKQEAAKAPAAARTAPPQNGARPQAQHARPAARLNGGSMPAMAATYGANALKAKPVAEPGWEEF